MNIIVTGHKGLIGKALVERLQQEKMNIVQTIDIRSGIDINDINDECLQLTNFNKDIKLADTLIHLAAYCKIAEGIENPNLIYRNNVKGMYNVLEYCRKNDIKKIIFTSSSRVLSKEKNVYTASKLYGEELVKGYNDSYGIKYVIIRPSTVYGPGHDLTGRLMSEWVTKALRYEELPIFGDENKTLDFTYIDDFVDGFMLAYNEENKEFNISGEEEVKLRDLADIILSKCGLKGGSVGYYSAEIAQPQKVRCDTSAIRALGYKPKVDLEEGVKRVVEWYKNNPEVWKK